MRIYIPGHNEKMIVFGQQTCRSVHTHTHIHIHARSRAHTHGGLNQADAQVSE